MISIANITTIITISIITMTIKKQERLNSLN